MIDAGAAADARRALSAASHALATHIDGCIPCWCSEQAHHNPNADQRPEIDAGFCVEGKRLQQELKAAEGAVQLVVYGEGGARAESSDSMLGDFAAEAGVFLSDDPEDRHL